MWALRVALGQQERLVFPAVAPAILTFMLMAVFAFVLGLGHARLTPTIARHFAELLLAITFSLVLVNLLRTGEQITLVTKEHVMAKKRRKKKQTGAKTSRAPVQGATRRTRAGGISLSRPLIGAAVVALIAVLAVAGWWTFSSRASVPETEGAASTDQATLSQVESFPCPNRDHVQPGTRADYSTDPPVCGQHYATWVKPGFYTTEQVPEEIVHSLEHGYVVIYYDQPEPAVLQALQDLAGRFTGEWDGVVVVPKPGLNQAITLTAWGKMLRLDTFDENAVMTFLDAYRGRGPEHPVR